jgi:antitoxin component YwqK of YwqJK toxin-antitoxin module
MLPLKLTSTSAYKLNKTDTVALVRINMVNNYSGLYYMYGVIRNTTNAKDTLVYKMARNLKATDNGQTVRVYHYKNEFIQGDNIDYRPSNTFKITVNADNTLSFATWKNFAIITGGGKYYPDLKLYDLWYTFTENGVIKKTVGYLYKATTTTAAQRVIDDWIEVHPLGK